MTDDAPPSPDSRAECFRCGAIVRYARRGRHLRHHEWEDELARRLAHLEASGGEAEPISFGGTEDGVDVEAPLPEPEPERSPAAAGHELTEPAPEPVVGVTYRGGLRDDDARAFS